MCKCVQQLFSLNAPCSIVGDTLTNDVADLLSQLSINDWDTDLRSYHQDGPGLHYRVPAVYDQVLNINGEFEMNL
jgi:hypothetical protein